MKWNFVKMQGSLDTNLQEIMSALSYGFSLPELLWTKLEGQTPYPGKIGLAAIKARSPIGFTFVTDMHSNLLPDGIEQFDRLAVRWLLSPGFIRSKPAELLRNALDLHHVFGLDSNAGRIMLDDGAALDALIAEQATEEEFLAGLTQ